MNLFYISQHASTHIDPHSERCLEGYGFSVEVEADVALSDDGVVSVTLHVCPIFPCGDSGEAATHVLRFTPQISLGFSAVDRIE